MTEVLAPYLIQTFQNQAGTAVAIGGKLFTYIAGTTTKQVTYTDSTGSTPNANPIILDATGSVPYLWLDPTLVYKFVLAPPNDTDPPVSAYRTIDNVYPSFNASTPASVFGAILYPILPSESAVTVVNQSYPPMYVDRYLTNTTPGTTPMQSAFSAAVSVAQVASGTVTYGAGPYLLSAPVNCTFGTTANQYGIRIQGPAFSFDHPVFPLIAKHTGVAIFDCTGNDSITFSDVAMTTDSVTYPQTGVLWARNNSGQNSQSNHLRNCMIDGYFSASSFYNYASENNSLTNCFFVNRATTANTATRIYTGQNVKNLASTFVTTRPSLTPISCTDHNDFGCQDQNLAGTSTSDCIYLEQTDTFKKYGGWGLSASGSVAGRALVYVDLTNASSNYCSINGLTGESSTFIQNYGILVSEAPTTANSYIPLGWSVNDCKLTALTAALATAGTNTTLDTWTWQGNLCTTSNAISIAGTLRNSPLFAYGIGITFTLGTSQNNNMVGATEDLVLTTRTKDSWIDVGTSNKTIATVSTTGITSTLGGLVARARLSLSGPCLTFNIVLASGSGTMTIAAGATLTLVSPGGQSFALADLGACRAVDQTAGTGIDGAVSASGANALITLPVGIAATAHTVVVSGTVFLA